MKKSYFYSVIVLLAIMGAFLGRGIVFADQSMSPMAPKNKDANIIKVIEVIDKNEITAAKYIIKRDHVNNEVLNYAKFLYMQHSKNLAQAQNLAQKLHLVPTKNKIAFSQHKEGKHLMHQLSRTKYDNLQKVYMNAMVKGHQDAANLIDNVLIPNAKSPELISFLKMTSMHVKDHLKKAKMIQSSL